MPVERIGKLRESLTVNSEEYKEKFLRYLMGRQYYSIKASSDVEATFPDVILTRKGEKREYWLEVKATDVSLGDSDFLKQLAKYLAEYLSRTPENRFKLILACYRLVDAPYFDKVFAQFDAETISGLIAKMRDLSDPQIKATIERAQPQELRKFFEETTVKEADLKGLEFAEAKVTPRPPAKPSLAEADYASAVVSKFGDVSPLKETDRLFLNLFKIDLPSKILVAKTPYKSSMDIFAEKPTTYPPFDLRNEQIFSFDQFDLENPLFDFITHGSVTSLDLAEFAKDPNNEYIVKVIINRWIKQRCRKIGLEFNKRTQTYYYPRKFTGDGLVTASWKPKERYSVRELTRPMKSDGKVNYWVHRGAMLFATVFSGEFYVQIRPRFLFSLDGIAIMEGSEADKRDRKFRKSKYNRNPNQLYDVRFWCRHVFPETEYLGIMSLAGFIGDNSKQAIKLLDQASIDCEYKPNQDEAVDIEALDVIESTSEQLNKLDSFIGE